MIIASLPLLLYIILFIFLLRDLFSFSYIYLMRGKTYYVSLIGLFVHFYFNTLPRITVLYLEKKYVQL